MQLSALQVVVALKATILSYEFLKDWAASVDQAAVIRESPP